MAISIRTRKASFLSDCKKSQLRFVEQFRLFVPTRLGWKLVLRISVNGWMAERRVLEAGKMRAKQGLAVQATFGSAGGLRLKLEKLANSRSRGVSSLAVFPVSRFKRRL